ncbi:MAG: AAA family ATPase [Actinomycetes bacterium]
MTGLYAAAIHLSYGTAILGGVNPFRFEGPIDPADLIGRETEVELLVRHALDRRIVSVAAPRRYGKTSLLRAAGARLEHEHGFVVAHVDLLGLAGPEDFAARFGSAWRRATAGVKPLKRQLEQVAGGLSELGVTLLGSGLTVRRRDRAPDSALAVVHALLDLPGEAQEPVLVVLDEFQALHAAWPQGEGVLRSHTQSPQQTGRVAWAFAGSEPSLLAAAFEDSGRAYYQQALRVPMRRLPDPELARGIAERFESTGRAVGAALGPLIELAAGHPQRAMLLAHLLHEVVPNGAEATDRHWARALDTARRLVHDECTAVWESLTPPQRAALRAVHVSGSPTAAGAGHTVSRASRQSAGAVLVRRGLVELDERPGPRGGRRYRLVDPMLGDWLVQRGSG